MLPSGVGAAAGVKDAGGGDGGGRGTTVGDPLSSLMGALGEEGGGGGLLAGLLGGDDRARLRQAVEGEGILYLFSSRDVCCLLFEL